MANELVGPLALHDDVFSGAPTRDEISGARTFRVFAEVYLCISVAKLDGDVTLKLILETNSL